MGTRSHRLCVESPLVLAVSLSALAGWTGIDRRFGNLTALDALTSQFGARALICAAVIWGGRELHRHVRGADSLREVLEHFAANILSVQE